MYCKTIGMEIIVAIKPKKNFHNLIPAKKRIKIPSQIMLSEVPKSGCITTKIKGIINIKNGKNK